MENPRGDGPASSDDLGLHRGLRQGRDTRRSEEPVLRLEGVSARYPGAPALAIEGATLCARAGDVIAILGANGAGKSTLLRIAAGLLEPCSGLVHVCGAALRKADAVRLARVVAFVPQSELVPWGFRVREVVAMGRAPHQRLWMRELPSDRLAIEQALARCDLTDLAGRAVETLSGGEQRRVAIARAIAQNPKLLLLDEPGAFLDVRHRLELDALLADLASAGEIAVVVAMHDLDAASRLASRVVLMRGGRIAQSGTPDEVMTRERLGDAFGAEVTVGVHGPSGDRYFVPSRRR